MSKKNKDADNPYLKKKKTPEEERYDAAVKAEADLGHLRHTFTIMDQERQAYIMGGNKTMAKQQKVLDIMKKENRNLLTDLEIATSHGKEKIDRKIMKDMAELLEENEEIAEEAKVKRKHIQEINDQIYTIEKQVIIERSQQITDAQHQARIFKGQIELDKAESKLDVQIKKFCTTLTENRQLQDEINHLLIERRDFNKQWEGLISNLTLGRKFMMDLIEQSTLAYDEREEWCSKLQALRSRAHRDLIINTEEMIKIQGSINHKGKLREFFEQKGQKRLMTELMARIMRKREMRKRETAQTLEKYREIWKRIKDFTGMESIEEVATEHYRTEMDNFSKMQAIISINDQMEKTSLAITDLTKQIDGQREITQKRKVQQNEALTKLKAQLQKITLEANAAEEALEKKDAHLEEVLKKIEQMFVMVKCSSDPLVELLGNTSGTIHKYNVLLYLKLIEDRVNEIIANVYYSQLKEKKKGKKQTGVLKEEWDKPGLYLTDDIVPTTPCPLCVQSEQVSDVIDTLQFAYSRAEISEKLKKRLALPDGLARLHNVSACNLPESRKIIQKRYL